MKNKPARPAGQNWDPERYARNAGFVPELGRPVLELLNPRAGERILDLGCGDGVLTQALSECGCRVVGIDASEAQVEAARRRGIEAHVIDAHELLFDDEFDAVFSNAALHWMLRPDDVLAGVARGLKAGGRFVGEFGGEGNVSRVVAALTESLAQRGISAAEIFPWYFPSVDEFRSILESAGFSVISIELIPRLTPLPGRLVDWLETFAESFLQVLPETQRREFFTEVEAALEDSLSDSEGRWSVDYVRLRFSATKLP